MSEDAGEQAMSGVVMASVTKDIDAYVFNNPDQLMGEKVALYGEWMRYCQDRDMTPIAEPHIYVMETLFEASEAMHTVVAEGWATSNMQHMEDLLGTREAGAS